MTWHHHHDLERVGPFLLEVVPRRGGGMRVDSLSHSCPTCEGTGYDSHSRMAYRRPCPDCIGGYPKAAVERAAKALWDIDRDTRPTDVGLTHFAELDDHLREFYEELALAAIRAFHNEGSEQ